jgi:hypothetical protein
MHGALNSRLSAEISITPFATRAQSAGGSAPEASGVEEAADEQAATVSDSSTAMAGSRRRWVGIT